MSTRTLTPLLMTCDQVAAFRLARHHLSQRANEVHFHKYYKAVRDGSAVHLLC